MKFFLNALVLAICSLAFSGCMNENSIEPTIIIEPPTVEIIGRDTISAGTYMGFTLGERAERTYAALKDQPDSLGIKYVNIVSNIFTDVNELEDRLQLYQSLLLDETKGTDSGVQLTFEEGKIKSIYLNSGKKLSQWPTGLSGSSAVRTGDAVGTLYGKLLKISSMTTYKGKFERMSMFTKDVSKNFDSQMTISPQWYFADQIEGNKMDEVQLNFKDAVLSSIHVNHYQSYQ